MHLHAHFHQHRRQHVKPGCRVYMRARQTEELRTQQWRHELRKLSGQPANLVAPEATAVNSGAMRGRDRPTPQQP